MSQRRRLDALRARWLRRLARALLGGVRGEVVSALRADHLRPTRTLCVRSPDIRLRHRPRRAQLRGRALEFDAQGVHGEPFLFDPVQPEILIIGRQCGQLGVVAEREPFPAPGD